MKRIITPSKKKTVLIVDDDQVAGHIYRGNLQNQGFNVEIADQSESATQKLMEETIDLVIVDLCLPELNAVELIKDIRSNSATQSLPLIVLSNPFMSSLTRSAVEAGATKCIAKAAGTPGQMLEAARELGFSAACRAVTNELAETLETDRENFAATLLTNAPETLAKLRASHQAFARTEQDDTRRAELSDMHRQLRSLAGSAALLDFQEIAYVGTALEALLIELRNKPAKITSSVVRTVAQAIDTLASLFEGAANPEAERPTSPKILVVDDEIISRETICSALAKADLHAVSVEDPLAAQSLLEHEHFDLIFLDVEMPGQTGLELCVKIREMTPNRTTPVVFVTSHSDFGSRAQSTLSGGNDFIAKPFLLVELAVKALTLLFKKNAPPAPTAIAQANAPAGAAIHESQAAANHAALSLHHS